MVSLGKGFYEFSFASAKDLRSVWSLGSWNVQPGILRLMQWSNDFKPNSQKISHSRCWIRPYDLPQEYWRPRILFEIAGGNIHAVVPTLFHIHFVCVKKVDWHLVI